MTLDTSGPSEPIPSFEPNVRLALYWLLNPEAVPLDSFNDDVKQLVAALSSKLPPRGLDTETQALITAHEREAAEIDKAREIASYNRAKARALEIEEDDQRAQVAQLVDALLSETLTSDALDAIEELTPVVDGLFYRGTVARLNGKPGSMKSFVALDVAGCVGNGMPWAGREVCQGNVLYLVAEGGGGIKKRVRAWEQHHGRRMQNVYFLPRPVQIAGTEWLVLEEACKRIKPALVIVDTQARSTVGIEESSNERMSLIFARVERLAKGADACALLVHHTGHIGEHGRGASNVVGAVQTELLCRKDGKGAERVISLRIDKTKDDDDQAELRFLPRVVAVEGMRRMSGEQDTSIVLVPERAHVFNMAGLDPAVSAAVQLLDQNAAPYNLGRDRMRKWLAERNLGVANNVLADAISHRKKREALKPADNDDQDSGQLLPLDDD